MMRTNPGNTLPLFSETRFPEQGDLLQWCLNMGLGTGILLMLVGAVYLMYGWSLHKGLVTLNAAALGGFAGAWIGDKAGYPLASCITGSLVIALITFPLRKWAIASMGALCGIIVGMGIWRSVGLDPE